MKKKRHSIGHLLNQLGHLNSQVEDLMDSLEVIKNEIDDYRENFSVLLREEVLFYNEKSIREKIENDFQTRISDLQNERNYWLAQAQMLSQKLN